MGSRKNALIVVGRRRLVSQTLETAGSLDAGVRTIRVARWARARVLAFWLSVCPRARCPSSAWPPICSQLRAFAGCSGRPSRMRRCKGRQTRLRSRRARFIKSPAMCKDA
ncbi:hypothetical protein BD310DRAFT_76466 [Dichomitus squalens]|uniref:Uncharacterized protein n=1 Tax=Dichomitus squalens TaxID=114155 RepID=A0A4Q9PJX3_9APHY|nr:hypothetical protein BD310DRAFT_76466 [Dichomitus squalens]